MKTMNKMKNFANNEICINFVKELLKNLKEKSLEN